MKVLLEVVLILTVIAAGVTYGYYDFRVERGYRGSYLTHLGEIPDKIRKIYRKGPSKEGPEICASEIDVYPCDSHTGLATRPMNKIVPDSRSWIINKNGRLAHIDE